MLYIAAQYGDLEVVRLLLDRGADKDAKCDVRTAVASALRCGTLCPGAPSFAFDVHGAE